MHDQTCDTSFDYLIIRVYGAGAALDNFIAIFEPYPYSNSSIYEENPAAGNFTQLDAVYIDNCSVGFDNTGMAEYRVYLSSLGPGTYKFSGLRIVA